MITPGSTIQDANGAYAILAVIADPKASKQRLDDLLQAAKESAAKEASARAAIDTANKAHAAAEKLHSDAQTVSANHDKKAMELAEREAALEAREKMQQDTEASKAAFMNKRSADLDAKDAALSQREKAILDTETKARDTVEQATKLRDELQARLAKIKEAAA